MAQRTGKGGDCFRPAARTVPVSGLPSPDKRLSSNPAGGGTVARRERSADHRAPRSEDRGTPRGNGIHSKTLNRQLQIKRAWTVLEKKAALVADRWPVGEAANFIGRSSLRSAICRRIRPNPLNSNPVTAQTIETRKSPDQQRLRIDLLSIPLSNCQLRLIEATH
jgi:hypothetical protein